MFAVFADAVFHFTASYYFVSSSHFSQFYVGMLNWFTVKIDSGIEKIDFYSMIECII